MSDILYKHYFYTTLSNVVPNTNSVKHVRSKNYINNTKYKHENNELITILHLTKFFETLVFLKNPVFCVAEFFSYWFIKALTEINQKNTECDNNKIWKTRYEVINKVIFILRQFIIQIEILFNVKIPFTQETRVVIFVLLHHLVNQNILLCKNISYKQNTEKLIALSKASFYNQNSIDLGVYTHPQKIVFLDKKLVYVGAHYTSIQKIVHKNKASKHNPEIANINFLEKRSELKVFVNWELLDRFKKLTLKAFKSNPFISEDAFLEHLNFLKLNTFVKENQQEFSKLFFIKYIYALEKKKLRFKEGLFFTYYFDFRGRIYTNSVIGYTHNKFFRYIYNYGFYSQNEINEWGKKNITIPYSLCELILLKTSLLQVYPNIDFTKIINQYYLYTVFFEIGKIFKNNYIYKNNGKLNNENFIKIGIEYYNNYKNLDIDLYDQIAIEVLINALNWVNKGVYLKLPVFKDATASAIQILLLLLGSKDHNNYKICNFIDTNYWYDTYFYIINRFFSEHAVKEEYKKNYFTRSNLKKAIMTYNYEATFYTCLKEFHDTLDEKTLKNSLLIEELTSIFKLFYNFLKTIFEKNDFFLMPSKYIVTVFAKQWACKQHIQFETSDNVILHYDYYKLIRQRIDRIIDNQRETIQFKVTSEEVDTQKMFRALRANLIHSFDGLLVRVITLRLNHPIMTIHDSFGIDILEIKTLEIVVAAEMQKIFEEDFFNLSVKKSPVKIQSPYVLL